MIVKILDNSASFNAVRYNTNKINEGKGKLIEVRNFNVENAINMTPSEVKGYLQSISAINKRVRNPQFHATISCEGRDFNSSELKFIANEYMSKMGYSKQPYIIVFHGDTNNNHVHVVSTRVDFKGKKIKDSYENLRSLKAINEIIKQHYPERYSQSLKEIKGFSVENKAQFLSLLRQNKYSFKEVNDTISIYKNGEKVEDFKESNLKIRVPNKSNTDKIKKIMDDYSRLNKDIHPVYNHKNQIVNYTSEFTHALREKDIDIVFSFSGDKKPFGFTVIDNNSKQVFKGSHVAKLSAISNYIPLKADERSNYTDELKASRYNVSSQLEREMLSRYLNIDISNVRINNNVVPINDINSLRHLFKDCKTMNDVLNLEKSNYFNVYTYKGHDFIITDKNQILRLDSLLPDGNLYSKSINDKEMQFDFSKDSNNEDSQHEEIDDDINREQEDGFDLEFNPLKAVNDYIKAISLQSTVDDAKRKKRKR